jgi:small subunit ribosomal protein S6
MPSYETTVITKSASTEDQVTAIKTKVESILAAHQGQLASYEDWGTRRFSYDIQKESRGRYVYFAFTGNNATVAELERNFRINENIVRFLSVNISDEEDVEALKKPSPMKRVKKPSDEAGENYDS